jgi:hypothetical protein
MNPRTNGINAEIIPKVRTSRNNSASFLDFDQINNKR